MLRSLSRVRPVASLSHNRRLSSQPCHLLAAGLLAKTNHRAMVPYGPMAFFPGELIHTNEFLVHLGDSHFAEMSAREVRTPWAFSPPLLGQVPSPGSPVLPAGPWIHRAAACVPARAAGPGPGADPVAWCDPRR